MQSKVIQRNSTIPRRAQHTLPVDISLIFNLDGTGVLVAFVVGVKNKNNRRFCEIFASIKNISENIRFVVDRITVKLMIFKVTKSQIFKQEKKYQSKKIIKLDKLCKKNQLRIESESE